MSELSERNFYNDLKMKFTSPSGGIQQAGEPETAAKSVTHCFTFGFGYKHAYTRLYFIITNFYTSVSQL